MFEVASQDIDSVLQSSEMLPRRWYTDEIAPARHQFIRLTTATWRYRALRRRAREDAAPIFGAAPVYRRRPVLALAI
ncbi:MAG: hypothetical protein U0Z44_00230 [Kouleothrix sp.]|jgi:hypothetical protein|nr:hypothetical protein [Kouleothrix sp.]